MNFIGPHIRPPPHFSVTIAFRCCSFGVYSTKQDVLITHPAPSTSSATLFSQKCKTETLFTIVCTKQEKTELHHKTWYPSPYDHDHTLLSIYAIPSVDLHGKHISNKLASSFILRKSHSLRFMFPICRTSIEFEGFLQKRMC